MTKARDRGFTLLEIIVALLVLGFLMLGLSQGVRFGLTVWGAQARMIGRTSDLDAVDRALRHLIRDMNPGTAQDPLSATGTAAKLVFTSVLPMAANHKDADIALFTDPKHRLVLQWLPHLHAKRLKPPPAPRSEVLLTNVDQIELAYWRSAPEGGNWVRDWSSPGRLPALVRIRIVFRPGDPRHWPDVVAAPMRLGVD